MSDKAYMMYTVIADDGSVEPENRLMEPLQVWCEDCMKTGNCRFYDRPFAPKGHACLDFENSHLNRHQHRIHQSRKVAEFEEEERREKAEASE
jgi:hypothetical protein